MTKKEQNAANKRDKKAVVQAKAGVINEIYEELETLGGEKIYGLAKRQNGATKDLTHQRIKTWSGESTEW